MKNIKRQVICILAVLTAVIMLAGCSIPVGIFDAGDKNEFLGTWTAIGDVVESINEGVREGLAGNGEELTDYLEISSFEVTLVFTFNKDNTYSVSVDKDALKTTVENTKDEIKDGALAFLEDTLEKSGSDMTVEDLLKTSGLDLDALADSSLDYNKISESFANDLEREGNWKAENGELYLSESVNEEADDLSKLYEITSDGIKLTEPEGSESDEMGLYPLLLKKD